MTNKKIIVSAFLLGCLLGAASLIGGCGGVASQALPESLYVEATGTGEVRVGVDQYPPLTLEHDGDVSLYWDIDSWPPKLISNAGQCARMQWMFLILESDGCVEPNNE